MKTLIRRIYADATTGQLLADTGSLPVLDDFIQPTVDDDFRAFITLRDRDREQVLVLELEPGQYEEEFAQAIGFRVNPETGELEFAYPDPNAPNPEEPVFQPSLTQQLQELKDKYAALEEESTVNQFALMELHMMILEMQNGGEAV